MTGDPSIPPTQLDALKWVLPYLLILLGGPAGVWGIVKAIAAFRDWLKDTRSKVEAVPGQIVMATSEAMRYAREAQSVGLEARAATESLKDDVNNLGGKVNRLDTQQTRDGDRMTRIEKDHEKLAGEFHTADKALPKILENERHAMRDGPLNNISLRLDEVKDDVKDVQRDVKELRGGKGA